jgi:hypothetical protein
MLNWAKPGWLGLLTTLAVIAVPLTGSPVTLTNLAELEQLNLQASPANCELHLEGVVWLSNTGKCRRVL